MCTQLESFYSCNLVTIAIAASKMILDLPVPPAIAHMALLCWSSSIIAEVAAKLICSVLTGHFSNTSGSTPRLFAASVISGLVYVSMPNLAL
jgi:hypothetical protein